MRVFTDTNVLLSGFFGNGLCSELILRLLKSDHTLLIGEPVAKEFTRIARDKFHVEPAALSYALEVMRRQTLISAIVSTPSGIPDPDDAPIIACALAAEADMFVTGDSALLKLEMIQSMPIVSPRECWERLFLTWGSGF